MKKLFILALSIFVTSAQAQTYNTLQWGLDKTATPYAFGANINGTWSNLGTVSSAGVWTIPSSNTSFRTVSVTDYGADPTGIADSTTAITNAATAAALTGQSLYVPGGTYLTSAQVYLPNNSRVMCAANATFKPQKKFTVFATTNYNRNITTDTTPTTSANQTNSNVSIDGCTFDFTSVANVQGGVWGWDQFASPLGAYLAKNVKFTNNTIIGGNTQYNSSNGAKCIGVDGCIVSNNTFTNVTMGSDNWKGTTNLTVSNNNITTAASTWPNSYCVGVNGVGTSQQDQETSANFSVINNYCTVYGNSTGIQFDALGSGSQVKDGVISGNTIVGGDSTTRVGLYGRGNVSNININNNTFDTITSNITANMGEIFASGGPFTCSNCATTTNGSNLVVIASPTLANKQYVSVGNYIGFVSSSPVGGITFGTTYYPVTSVSYGTSVTIAVGTNATSTATGGGAMSMNVEWNWPTNIVFSGNKFSNVSNTNSYLGGTNGPLVVVGGTGFTVNDNMASGGTFGTFIYSTSVEAAAARSPVGQVYGNKSSVTGSWSSSLPAFVLGDGVMAYSQFTVPVTTFSGSAVIPFTQNGTGAVTATVDSKLKQIVSLIDFGADPTGVADSSTAMQNALTYVSTNKRSLQIPCGIYKMSSSVSATIPGNSSFSIRGSGQDCTKLQYTGSNGMIITYTNQYSSFLIDNLTFTTSDPSGSYTALRLRQPTAVNYALGNDGSTTQVNNVNYTGTDIGAGNLFYWGKGLDISNISYVNVNGGFFNGPISSATSTISIGSPATITANNYFTNRDAVYFTTTGALPTGMVASTSINTAYVYYVVNPTATNFQITKQPVQFTGITTSGNNVISNVSMVNWNRLAAGDTVTGTNIPASTTVSSFSETAGTITISNNASGSGTSTDLDIGPLTTSGTQSGIQTVVRIGAGNPVSYAGLTSPASYAVVLNLNGFQAQYCGVGVDIGDFQQGITITGGSNFSFCNYGVKVLNTPTGTPDELIVADSQFNTSTVGVDSRQMNGFLAHDNLFILNGGYAILGAGNAYSIHDNFMQSAVAGTNYAIEIPRNSTVGGFIRSNTLQNFYSGIAFPSSGSNISQIAGNKFASVTNEYQIISSSLGAVIQDLPQRLVSTLPACQLGIDGATFNVYNGSAANYNGQELGGGTLRRTVKCDGNLTQWTQH